MLTLRTTKAADEVEVKRLSRMLNKAIVNLYLGYTSEKAYFQLFRDMQPSAGFSRGVIYFHEVTLTIMNFGLIYFHEVTLTLINGECGFHAVMPAKTQPAAGLHALADCPFVSTARRRGPISCCACIHASACAMCSDRRFATAACR